MTDPGGEFRGNDHVFPVRVYYEDTDAGGVVYYANYLKFAERARSEMIRHLGLESSRIMAEQGVGLAVRRCNAEFLQPARLDDLVEVHTTVSKIQGASLELTQTVRRGAEDLVRMELRLACLSLDGGPARLPGEVREALLNHFNVDRQG